MKLAILGATGKVGRELLAQALDNGHDVRVLVRDRSKLTRSDAKLTVIEGSATDAKAVSETLAGCGAVLSALGGTGKQQPTLMTSAMELVLRNMSGTDLRRLVVITGFGVHVPGDEQTVSGAVMLAGLRLFAGALVRDADRQAALIQASTVDWTLVRAPRLVGGAVTGKYRVGRLRLGLGSRLPYSDAAAFMLRCAVEGAHVRDTPMVAS